MEKILIYKLAEISGQPILRCKECAASINNNNTNKRCTKYLELFNIDSNDCNSGPFHLYFKEVSERISQIIRM
jgi:hypothetical protein